MPENVWLLDFYGTFLRGQYTRDNPVLSLTCIIEALDLVGIQGQQRADSVERLLYLHALMIEKMPKS